MWKYAVVKFRYLSVVPNGCMVFNILVYLSVASFVYSVRIINAKFFVCLIGGGKVGLIMSFKI